MFDEAPFGRLAPVFAVALALTLSACGGGDGSNPVTGGSDSSTDDGTPDEEDTSDGEDVTTPTTGDNTTRTTGDLTGITYNAADNTITVDDLPFDGDGVYVNTGVTAVAGFNVYASQRGDETGQRQYYAVYRKDTYVEAGSVQTGDYFDFGFGGAQYKRSNDTVTLPIGTGEAVYTGRYGGTRVLSPGSGGSDDVQLVAGDARIIVDFLDFETIGAVEGEITNRTFYDVNGNLLGSLPVIVLLTAEIDSDGFIGSGEASTFDSDNEVLQSGSYDGVFAGPNGEQITGVIILEGDAFEDSIDDVREIGVFTVSDD